ncbi:hypothetical protein Tco_0855462 [Tanacetum coccineum]
MEETFYVTFNEANEVIRQSCTILDDINFHENKSVPNDDFFVLRNPINEYQRSKVKDSETASANECLYADLILDIKPKTLLDALKEEGWVFTMQEELNQFERNKARTLVYAHQTLGFESIEFSNYVFKLDKALYELKQALRAWYQAKPKESHLVDVKRIFGYLKETSSLVSGGCQIVGGKLACWSAKKHNYVSMSSAEVEYVAATGCCAQVLSMKSQLADYEIHYDKVPIFCDNTSATAISNNLVLYSRTKHMDIMYHFMRDQNSKGDIETSFTRVIAELESVKDALETLGLSDEKDNSLKSSALIKMSPSKIRKSRSKKTVAETEQAEELEAITDTPMSLEASKLAEEVESQPEIVAIKKSMPNDEIVSMFEGDDNSDKILSPQEELMADKKCPTLLADYIKEKISKVIKKALNFNLSDLLHQKLKIVHKTSMFSTSWKLTLHADLLPEIFTAKNLITTINTTFDKMTELVDLLTHIVKGNMPSLPPLIASVRGEKLTTDMTKEEKHKSLFADDEKDQPELAEEKPAKEVPTPKRLEVMMDIPIIPPLSRIDKDKSIVAPFDDSALKVIMPLMEQSGSAPSLSYFKNFKPTNETSLTYKEVVHMMKEEMRLENIKKSNEESEKSLEKMNLAKKMAQKREL